MRIVADNVTKTCIAGVCVRSFNLLSGISVSLSGGLDYQETTV